MAERTGDVTLTLPPVVHDTSTPTLRQTIGTLLVRGRRSDFAVHHVRLAAIDLSAAELASARCRLLLGRFDADMLADLNSDAAARRRLELLASFLDSGRLEVRAAGMVRWYPDFSVHYRVAGETGGVALLGAHQLTPPNGSYDALAATVRGPDIAPVARQFHRLWRRAHDVRDVIRSELRRRGA